MRALGLLALFLLFGGMAFPWLVVTETSRAYTVTDHITLFGKITEYDAGGLKMREFYFHEDIKKAFLREPKNPLQRLYYILSKYWLAFAGIAGGALALAWASVEEDRRVGRVAGVFAILLCIIYMVIVAKTFGIGAGDLFQGDFARLSYGWYAELLGGIIALYVGR